MKLAPLLGAVGAGGIKGLTIVSVLVGLAYTVRCDIAATQAGRSFESCWLTGIGIMGVGGGASLGFNVPNPALDKARHAIALDLEEREKKAAAPPEPPVPAAYGREQMLRDLRAAAAKAPSFEIEPTIRAEDVIAPPPGPAAAPAATNQDPSVDYVLDDGGHYRDPETGRFVRGPEPQLPRLDQLDRRGIIED